MPNKNVNNMIRHLRGYFNGARMTESLRALSYMKSKHGDQKRKGGDVPYIVHPLGMACFAVALGIRDDNMIATFLLHDVCEDCGVYVDDLPFNSAIKHGVKLMTIRAFPNEDKYVTKTRYYNELLDDQIAILCKASDRYSNLTSMVGVLSDTAIVKNVVETHCLLLPMLKEAKERWPEIADYLHVYRTIIADQISTIAYFYGIELNDDNTASPSIEEVLSPDFNWARDIAQTTSTEAGS